jgi:hypothetical protein
MGVNAEAWAPHRPDFAVPEDLPARLNHSCPAHEVWHWDQTDSRRNRPWTWDVAPSEESMAEGLCGIEGPGIIVHIHLSMMVVWSLARWRGFIQHPDVRRRVRNVTTKVLRVLDATELVWLPESDGAPWQREAPRSRFPFGTRRSLRRASQSFCS